MDIKVRDLTPSVRIYRLALSCEKLSSVLADRDDIRCLSEARVEVAAYRIEMTVYLRGSIETPVQINCSRCLGTFDSEITSQFEMALAKSKTGNRPVEDIGIGTYEGDRIDLIPICVESFGLNLPQALLCSPNCKGLCYICGAELNETACKCPR